MICCYQRMAIFIITFFTACLLTSAAGSRTRNPLLQRADPWCQYRNAPYAYPPDVFRYQTSYSCYFWSNPSWTIPGKKYPGTVTSSPGGLPYQAIIVDGVTMNADYTDPESVALIAATFKTKTFVDKWLACSASAMQCCDFMITLTNQDQVDGCLATWDGWQCWGQAKNYTTHQRVCPAFTYSSPPTCNHYGSKDCLDGTWVTDSDYTTCDVRPRLRERIQYHVIMMTVSLVVSVPAIVIFFSYRKLRQSTRVVLHRNLLIAIVARNILSITSKTAVLLDALRMNITEGSQTVMAQNGVPCRILAVGERLAGNAVFVTMLLLGIFLHRLLAAAFRGEPTMFWYYVGGAVVNCLPVIVWTALMATVNDHNCWTVDDGQYHWINDAPRITMLIVNLLLIIDIIRVLLTKLSSVKTGNSNNIRRTIKATVFLTPVFGIQFLFTAFRPNTSDCTAEQVYYYFSYGLDGLQGAVVSMLFCYFNNEVQSLLRRTFGCSKSGPDPRKTTFSTLVEPNNKDLSDPPTPIMDTRSIPHRPTTLDLPRGGSILRRTGSVADDFYTPKTSVAGSPPEVSFFTPKSSTVGGFYDCIDDEPIVTYQSHVGSDRDNLGLATEIADVGRQRSASEYYDVANQ